MRTLFTGIFTGSHDELQARYGGEVIHTPLIALKPVEDQRELMAAIADIDSYDYLLFTSRFAVKHWFEAGGTCGKARVVAIGEVTKRWLKEERGERREEREYSIRDEHIEERGERREEREFSIRDEHIEERGERREERDYFCVETVGKDDSYGVVSWFEGQPRGRVLIPRSNLAKNIIPDGLQTLGFTVKCVTAYVNVMPEHPQRIDLDTIDQIVFTSPSTIDNFIKLYGHLPPGKKYLTRGVVTEERFKGIVKSEKFLEQREQSQTRLSTTES